MKISKLYTGIVLASALIMTGCGDDNDNSVGDSSAANNKISYALFEPFTEFTDGKSVDAWGKQSFSFSNNGFNKSISTVGDSSSTTYRDEIEDGDIEYYVRDNTFVAVLEESEGQFYDINFVDDDTFKLRRQSDNGFIDSTYDVVTLDITGITKQLNNVDTGITTDLDYFPEGFNTPFPSGSQCYIFLQTPAQNFYNFSNYDDEGSMTIDEWIASEQLSATERSSLVKEMIGVNNELSAARYTEDDGDIQAVVRYNGVIYDASYAQAGIQDKENVDPTVDEVYCNQINDVASTFFEEQIKANYNK